MSAIAVVRIPSSLGGTARRYKLLIDGKECGSLAGADEVIVAVEPGEHEVQARIDWTESDVLRITAEPDETISLCVRPAAQTRLGMWKAMFGSRGFLKLEVLRDQWTAMPRPSA